MWGDRPKGFTWKGAFKFIEKLNKQKHAGYSDWRLPAKGEFKTLVDYANDKDHDGMGVDKLLMRIGFKNVRAVFYWSSTPSRSYTSGTNSAFGVYMNNIGNVNGDLKETSEGYVWPVRGGK